MKPQKVNHTPKGIKIIEDSDDRVILKYSSTNFLLHWFSSIISVIFILFLILTIIYFFSDDKPTLKSSEMTFILGFYSVFILTIYFYFSHWTKITINKDSLIVKNKKYHLNNCRIRGNTATHLSSIRLDYGNKTMRLPSPKDNMHDIVIYIQRTIKRFEQVPTTGADSINPGKRKIRF